MQRLINQGPPGSIARELHKLPGQAAETWISHANTDHLSGTSRRQEDWLGRERREALLGTVS